MIEKNDCNFSGVALGDKTFLTKECEKLLNEGLKLMKGINIYDLYGHCYDFNASANATNFTATHFKD